MKIAQVKKLTPFERLCYWITERESIRLKREKGEPPPWTDDEVLQQYRFTNVRRIDDRVSQWLLKNWYKPYKDHPNTLAAVCLARHFNLPFSLAAITSLIFVDAQPNLCAVGQVIRVLKSTGHTVFNGAYMVRGIGASDKTEMVLEKVCRPLLENPPLIDTASMQRSVEALLPYWGFSSFMAGQVVADLRWALSGTWLDKDDWAPLGPGSKRGMNRLHGAVPTTPLSQENFLNELRILRDKLCNRLLNTITRRLELMDYQNCLCEFDGYERTIWGEGRKKEKYNPSKPKYKHEE